MELYSCCFLPLYSNVSDRFNRYSMPVTKSKNGLYEGHHLDQTNTARFLFGEDEPSAFPRRDTPDHNFPTLVRRDDQIVSLPFLFLMIDSEIALAQRYAGCRLRCQLAAAAR